MAKGKKTGGRQLGSRNKDTLPILDVFKEFDYCPAREAIQLLKSGKVPPEIAINAHLKMMKFKYRELKSLELNIDDETKDKIESIEEYLRKLPA